MTRLERLAFAGACLLVFAVTPFARLGDWTATLPGERGGPLRWEAPWLCSGDEPHYWIQVHALLAGDGLDVGPAYRRAAAGEPTAGRRLAGVPFGRQSVWRYAGRHYDWPHVFECKPPGHCVRRPDAPAALDMLPERAAHQPGWPLLLAAVLWPLRDAGALLEAAAFVVPTGLGGILVLVALVRLFRRAGALGAWQARWLALGVVCATPVWHYTRTLFVEAPLAGLVTAAYALAWPTPTPPWAAAGAGALLGLAIVLKVQAVLFVVPLAVWWALRDRSAAWRGLAGPLLGLAVVAGLNAWQFGAPWHSGIRWSWNGQVRSAVVGLIASPIHGVLPIVPVALLGLVGWTGLRARARAVPLAACAIWAALTIAWRDWDGGFCYGPRHLVPVLPLACVGLAGLPALPLWRWRAARLAIATIAAVSLGVNTVAALAPCAVFGLHPWTLLRGP